MPIISSPGSLNLNGVIGQGLLLVEGDLSVQAGFDSYGIAIVKGQLKTTGTPGHFNGGVPAANVDLDDITVLGMPWSTSRAAPWREPPGPRPRGGR